MVIFPQEVSIKVYKISIIKCIVMVIFKVNEMSYNLQHGAINLSNFVTTVYANSDCADLNNMIDSNIGSCVPNINGER